MSGIKDQFNNMRKNMPKASMWLLLVAAFVVVLILLTLLMTRDKKQTDDSAEAAQPITVNATPNTVDFSDTNVESPMAPVDIVVSASAPVKITDIEYEKIDGLTIKNACTYRTSIDSETTCKITIEYKPKSATHNTDIVADIVWRDVNDAENMTNKTPINIKLGAIIPVKKTTTPEPVKVEPVYIDEEEEEVVVVEELPIQRAVDQIAPPMPLFEPEPEPEPVAVAPEACSDFALAGYGLSGTQTGWIKPEKGTYYFHPFSDVNCDSPTGIYNPDNGIITDIDDSGKKIGTDAEHIGYSIVGSGTLPNLRSRQSATTAPSPERTFGGMAHLVEKNPIEKDKYLGSAEQTESVISSMPYDRTFILRQFKPIPATIVSEIRADPSTYNCTEDGCAGGGVPVRATVDRNVYSDNGRTIILPAGTLLLGYLTGELPGPYKAIGRMKINWYQFIRPDGVEFNFADGQDPYSADAQGRVGVPGHGSTDYVEQIVMPLLTAIVPAAVNMIAPIADSFVNQIDLDNNTVVQSGKVRSSELAKQEVISAWNQVAQKLLVDALNNTVPPFSIAAGTRITVYSPVDLIVTCGENGDSKCAISRYGQTERRKWIDVMGGVRNDPLKVDYSDESWIGQARSFDLSKFCTTENGVNTADKAKLDEITAAGYDYRTVLAYCQSTNYKAINNAKQDALYKNQQTTSITYDVGSKDYNTNVLGLTYTDDKIDNPFVQPSSADTGVAANIITCEGGSLPDINGCCPGETYTNMGEDGFNCCPDGGGSCFPPITN